MFQSRTEEQSQNRSKCWAVSYTHIMPESFKFLPMQDHSDYLSWVFMAPPKKELSEHRRLFSLSNKEQKGALFKKTIPFVSKSELEGAQNMPPPKYATWAY